jgi:hypothetical protein
MGKQASLIKWRQSKGRKIPEGHPNNRNNIQMNNIIEQEDGISDQNVRTLIQQTIHKPYLNKTDKAWGHNMPPKGEHIFRVGLRNINSLPLLSAHSKNAIFTSDILQGQYDVFCATETNIAWNNVPIQDRLNERFRGHFEFSNMITSHNKDSTYKEKFQRGGTLMVCNGPACGRIIEKGTDDIILGRWSWMKLRGSKGLTLVIASLYRPVKSNGALSTYQQQKNVLRDMDIDVCPRQMLLQDLATQIKKWKLEGHQVIITGDFNEDVRSKYITQFFQELQMSELILKQHGLEAPNTYMEGSAPIDGIFGTRGLEAVYSGYRSFSDGLHSDHRTLWVDLDMTTLLGTIAPPLWSPKARRLQCNDPNLVKRFVHLRLKHYEEHKLDAKKSALEELLTSRAPYEEWVRLFEELDKLRVEGILYAEHQCRKLRMGNIPWSPDLQQSMIRICYYQRCRLKYCLGKNINSRTLLKWYRKANISQEVLSARDAIQKLQEEFKVYNTIKKKAVEKRRCFLEGLAESKAEEGDLKKENILNRMMREEMQN